MLNRYYPLVSVIVNNYALFSPHVTNSFCIRFFQWQGCTGVIACMLAEIILQMRLYALYSLDKRILVLMGSCFLLTSTASAVIMGSILSQITVSSFRLMPGLVFCVAGNIPDYSYAFWIPILAYESLLCGLALFRGFQTFRSSASPFRSGKYLVSILIRDSVLYFVVMFATYLTNLLVWIIASESVLEIPIGFSVAMSCVMGNRIILNVRKMNKILSHSDRSLPHRTLTSMNAQRSTVVWQGDRALSDIEMDRLRSLRAEA